MENTLTATKTPAALCLLWDHQGHSLSYSADIGESRSSKKDKAHRDTMRFLRSFARNELGLPDTAFEVRSNKGGIAVSGEITLHTNTVYVQVSASFCGLPAVMYRTVKSRKDYTGGHNRFTTFSDAFGGAENMRLFAKELQNMRG
jgi:hypothetical protein